jgi:hypothetical protein
MTAKRVKNTREMRGAVAPRVQTRCPMERIFPNFLLICLSLVATVEQVGSDERVDIAIEDLLHIASL